MTRLVVTASQISEVSNTSNSDVTLLTLTASLTSGKKYVVFISLEIFDSGSAPVVTLFERASNTTMWVVYRGRRDATDYWNQGGFAVWEAGSTGTFNFDLKWKRAFATGTNYVRNVRMVLMELGSNDQYALASDLVTSSTSYVDGCTLTFTPPSTGDYLVLAGAFLYNSRPGIHLLLDDGSTTVSPLEDKAMQTSLGGTFWTAGQVRNLTASSKTFKVRGRTFSGSSTISVPRILALRVDDMHRVQYAQDNTDNAGTNTSFTNVLSLSATSLDAAARDTIVLGLISLMGSSTSWSVEGRLTEDGTQIGATLFEPGGATIQQEVSFIAFKSAVGISNPVYNLDRKSESTLATTTSRHAFIAVIEPTSSAASVELTVSGGGRMDGEGAAPSVLAGTGIMLSPASAAILEGVGYAPGVEVAQAVYLTVAGSGAFVGAGYEVVVEVAEAIFLTIAASGEFEGVGAVPDVVAGQAVDLTIAEAAEFIGTGSLPMFAAGVEVTVGAAAGFEGVGAQPGVSVGVQVTVGEAAFEGEGYAPSVQAGQTVLLTVAEGGRLEGIGYEPGTVIGVLLVVAAAGAMEGEGHSPDLSIASGVDETVGGAVFEGEGHAPTVEAGTGVILTVGDGAAFEGEGAEPSVLAGTGARTTIGDGAAFVGTGAEPYFIFGFSTAVGQAASFIGRGYRVTFGPQEPEDYVTTVSGTFGASGVSATLRLRNQIETVTYDFASPGSGTIALERSRTPDGTAWEIVAGPFKTAVIGTVISRPNDRFRVRLRNYSAPVDYSIYDEDAIIREQRTAENEVIYQVKQSGLVVNGTITEV